VGPATVFVKGAGSYLDNQTSVDGYAVSLGAGVSVPVVKNVTATFDVTRQYGQDRVSQSDGNRVAVGLRYNF
jgi:outer membrane autotransporter protein